MKSKENLYSFDELRNLTIGTVESVSPAKIEVALETNAPQNTAINTGIPLQFPKINGYVLIPNESGALIGQIIWLGIHYSNYPKRKGFKDFDLIDLPYPLRKMTLTPLGILKKKGENNYEVERGVYSYPSVGDIVILPTQVQLRAIAENNEAGANIEIGTCPLAGNTPVRVNPDKLFGRHLAVLGNTGSGKSCSVAGLIRWSLEKAEQEAKNSSKSLNARFIILDPNGEYSKTFDDLPGMVRKFKMKINNDGNEEQLKVPAWMWNSQEWITFSQAAPGAQRPVLLDGLGGLKQGRLIGRPVEERLRRFLQSYLRYFQAAVSQLPNPGNWQLMNNYGRSLRNMYSDLSNYISEIEEIDEFNDKPNVTNSLNSLSQELNVVANNRSYTRNNGGEGFNEFTQGDINRILIALNLSLSFLPAQQETQSPITPDTPIEFAVDELGEFLLNLAEQEGGLSQFINMLSLRIRFLLSDTRMSSVVNPIEQITLQEWLEEYIGKDNAQNGQISIVDLSLVPSDIIHIIIAVLSRLVFEGIQRHRRKFNMELPTVLVLEEAHTFIREQRDDHTNYSRLCQETFERISREGRKFGLSMILSSQRPSELSATVLSQCNTFLLHRIVNDRDQDMVRRLVPDNIGDLLKELSILPTRKAILLGWATPIPVLVEMKYLRKEHQPQSEDPNFWDVWTGKEERKIDWKIIANDWQGSGGNGNDTEQK